MKNLVKSAVLFTMCAGLLSGITSCKDDDPNYDNVVPPVVEAIAPTLQGLVTTTGDAALSGATITLSGAGNYTATTDAQGKYSIANLKVGTYTVEAKGADVTPATGSITVQEGQAAIWNALLPKVVKEVAAKVTDVTVETKQEVTVPSVPSVQTTAPKIEVTVPANALSKPVELILTFNNSTAATTRANVTYSLLNMTLSASDPTVQFNQPISFSVNVAAAPSNVLLNGNPIYFTFENGVLTMALTELGDILVLATIETTESTSTEPIVFSTSEWNNLNGSADINVASTSYSFKIGGTITGADRILNNVLSLNTHISGNNATTVTANYDLDLVLPIGTALTVSGTQKVRTITYKMGTHTATATIYGDVTIKAVSYNRQHTGGSN